MFLKLTGVSDCSCLSIFHRRRQYRIVPAMAGELYRDVGTNYAAVLIEPEAASVIRGLTSGMSLSVSSFIKLATHGIFSLFLDNPDT